MISVRYGVVALGIFSSFAALIGVLAAFRAIRDNEAMLSEYPFKSQDGKVMFPKIIGGKASNRLGMACGIVMPFLTAGGWIWVGNLTETLLTYSLAVSLGFLVFTLIFVFFDKSGTNSREE